MVVVAGMVDQVGEGHAQRRRGLRMEEVWVSDPQEPHTPALLHMRKADNMLKAPFFRVFVSAELQAQLMHAQKEAGPGLEPRSRDSI